MKFSKSAVALLVLGAMATQQAHATNGYFPIAYGAKNEAMGGASIALPLDSVAAANNPAGMVMVGDRTDFQLTWFKPNRTAEISGNVCGASCSIDGTYDGNGRSNFFIPDFGYNRMINEDTSLGVSVFGNGGMNTQYNTNPFGAFGAQGNLGINMSQLFIAPAWAMKVNSTNAVGVAVNLAYQMFSATGLHPSFDGMSTDSTKLSDNGTDTSSGYGLRVGWIGQVTPAVTLGATYQTKTKMGKFSKYSGLFAEQGGFDIPSKYGFGIAVKAMPETTVAFDIERINYEDVASVSNSFDGLPTGPSNMLGANGGPGFGWKNITAYKLGVSHAYNSALTVRAGLDISDQPIPNSQTLLNIVAPGVVQNHLTLGGTWTMADKSEITVAYVHAFNKTVNGAGSIPAGLGGGEANLSMTEDSIGVSYGW